MIRFSTGRVWRESEAEGKEIGVIEDEPQADKPPGQGRRPGAMLPNNGAFDLFADYFGALFEGESGQRRAREVLDLNPDAAAPSRARGSSVPGRPDFRGGKRDRGKHQAREDRRKESKTP